MVENTGEFSCVEAAGGWISLIHGNSLAGRLSQSLQLCWDTSTGRCRRAHRSFWMWRSHQRDGANIESATRFLSIKKPLRFVCTQVIAGASSALRANWLPNDPTTVQLCSVSTLMICIDGRCQF